jgi:signal transduction histidine kinase
VLDGAARGRLFRWDLDVQTKDGRMIPVSWRAALLFEHDQCVGLVGIARDVRVERRLEEEKLKTIRALAASVAHEIRNPLGAIQSSVGLLKRDLDLEGDDARLMDIVFDETQRIGTIVSQFLEFARPREPVFQNGDICSVVSAVVTLAENDERALQGVEVLLVAEPNLPEVSLDPDKIKQVVWNLVSNALDAAPKGLVAVRVKAGEGNEIQVRIADNGPGMTPEVLAHAFEPFRTTKAQGTGLGLPISKAIVDAHGGTIKIESTPGAGTVVIFTLPTGRR